jgi:MFS family permease
VNSFWRLWLLPMMGLTLLPAAFFNLFAMRQTALIGCLLGIGLPFIAARVMKRGRRGDARRAAVLMGVAAGLATGLGAGAGPIIGLIFALGAWGGTRLLYAEIPEAAPPAPPPPPPSGPLADARIRLAGIQALALRGHEARLLPVARVIGQVLDDLEARPERIPRARRFLAVHLDGLERIATRIDAGATPPPALGALLRDLEAAARRLREDLRAEESAALDIQVKVLADRLREEGYS